MRLFTFLLLFLLLCASCKENFDHGGKTLLVEVDGNFLYKEDLSSALPKRLSQDDSLLFAEHYIRTWVEDVLLYDKAKTNIPDNRVIEQLVENYRRSLILHTYQQELINQKLVPEIPEQEIIDYYESNKQLFRVENPLIKGVFIKLPISAPNLTDVRKWYQTETQEAVEQLEKYSWQHAVEYDYFYDKWITVSDVLDKLPLNVSSPETYLGQNEHIELSDSAYHYFLNVAEYKAKGEVEPYEFARAAVQEMLVNVRQIEFIKDVKRDLYQQATKTNKIKYNY